MGLLDLFSPKTECDHCGRRVPIKYALYLRATYTCSPDCQTAWEAANPPLVARGGTRLEHISTAMEALVRGHEELNLAINAAGGKSRDLMADSALRAGSALLEMGLGLIQSTGGNVVSTGAREERLRQLDQSLMEFDRYSAEAQQHLYALELRAEAGVLEELELSASFTDVSISQRRPAIEAARAQVERILWTLNDLDADADADAETPIAEFAPLAL